MLVTALLPFVGPGWTAWAIDPAMLALGGQKMAYLAANVDSWLAGATRPGEWALIDMGVNDMALPATSQASYEADLAYVLDKIHAAWPLTKILVAKPWQRGYDTAANSMAGWIDNVLATRGPWAAVGHDERVWLKGADNGATMTYDGVHYSAAGNTEVVAQWQALMGF